MTIFQAFILGLVQGVAEFLPISSSGFLILIPKLFGWQVQELAYDAFLHLASLAAIVFALWPEVRRILCGIFVRDADRMWARLGMWIVLATIPALIVGYFAREIIEFQIRTDRVVAWSLIVWGIVLYVADRISRGRHKDVTRIGFWRAIVIGCAQVIALIPGTSRSGITITAGLFAGLSRETAARFSFLLAIPVVAAAGLLKLGDVVVGGMGVSVLPLIVGSLTTFVASFLTIKFLLAFLRKYSFTEFAIFRVLVGILILLL
jgi:undecaprenyl-diphosphatase